jgi:hypothetical protein
MSLTKIEWDSTKASAEDAPADLKLLDTVVPVYNEIVDLVEQFKKVEDLDTAVAEAVESSTDEEVVNWKAEIEKARKLIESREAKIDEKVRKVVESEIAPDFDKGKLVASYNDKRAELKKNGTGIRDMFKLLGYVESEVSPAGRESNFKGKNSSGETLLKVLDIPKLEGEKVQTGASEAVKEFNRNAKEWGRKNGFTVADKGALSTELKEKYSAATNTPIPS